MNIVILALQKLGDLIQATSLIASLQGNYPEAKLSIIFRDPSVGEAAGLYFPDLTTMKLTKPLDGHVSELLGECELLTNLSLDRGNLELVSLAKKAKVLGPRLVAGKLIVPPLQGLALSAMALERRLGFVNLVDIWRRLTHNPQKRLSTPRNLNISERLKGLLGETESPGLSTIAIHLGAGGRLRRYPVESMVEAVKVVAKHKDLKILLLGSRAERALTLKFMKLSESLNIPGKCVSLAGETKLSELAAILSKTELLISSDTGVAHLAASVGTKLIGLFFGPALSHETAPYTDKLKVIQGLAPCGPCTENLGCQRAACLALPPPWLVAELTRSALCEGTKGEMREGYAPEIGELQTYQGSLEGELFSLLPIAPFPAELTELSLSALILKKAALSLTEGARPQEALEDGEIERYKLKKAKPSYKTVESYLRHISKNEFMERQTRGIFLESAMKLLRSLEKPKKKL